MKNQIFKSFLVNLCFVLSALNAATPAFATPQPPQAGQKNIQVVRAIPVDLPQNPNGRPANPGNNQPAPRPGSDGSSPLTLAANAAANAVTNLPPMRNPGIDFGLFSDYRVNRVSGGVLSEQGFIASFSISARIKGGFSPTSVKIRVFDRGYRLIPTPGTLVSVHQSGGSDANVYTAVGKFIDPLVTTPGIHEYYYAFVVTDRMNNTRLAGPSGSMKINFREGAYPHLKRR